MSRRRENAATPIVAYLRIGRSAAKCFVALERCRRANYCSRKCQKIAWPKHKTFCDEASAIDADFDANKMKGVECSKNEEGIDNVWANGH